MKLSKKAQMSMIVYFVILLVGYSVVTSIIRDTLISDKDIKQKEELCETANRLAQGTSIDPIKQAGIKMCDLISLGLIPGKNYGNSQDALFRNIADKVAKAWEIWLEGSKENYFDTLLDQNFISSTQKCFIQYSFKIKKGMEPITSAELYRYLSEKPYLVGDTSDLCAGTSGGKCKEACTGSEVEVKNTDRCYTSEAPKCCISNIPCEDHGGQCLSGCTGELKPYTKWKCGGTNVCCVEEKNYITPLKYIQSNTGAIIIKPDLTLYPQEYEVDGEKISELYAIVFASRTTRWFLWETPDNVNAIIIAPFNDVSEYCAVRTGSSS